MSRSDNSGLLLLIAAIGLIIYARQCRDITPISAREIQREITVVSAKSGLPFTRQLIHAVIQQESNFNHRAVSRCGATGLMQLMPGTGREWHRKLGIKEPYDPLNRRQNITIGIYYLKHLVEHYDGDMELALTAYNQGYGRVNELLARNRTRNLKGILKDLGPDGRNYARNVLRLAG